MPKHQSRTGTDSMERVGEGGVLCPPAESPSRLTPSPAPSIESPPPPPIAYNVGWYRHRAEELGDLAFDMISEGLEGMAYGSSRKAAHYGRIALFLQEARAKELLAAHPEWTR